ncbi:hypothetical protein [Chryseobacterium polytrichastri]|uniref:Bacteriocin-type signal sequence-containing protein n=1 Tax=Chryseobacterium polytrichastri TaxID=1302687 RepID=A0A1M7DPK5_9FLAO|nr:hypothetical protein [Chryseobacterium polytrichastri]SHL81441.1 hypothetical protein SAMN05444267_102563 [Chryseobacterium polytrichastri]
MKKLDLATLEVKELSGEDMKNENGGQTPESWLIGFGIYLYDNRDRFLAGIKKGINDFK